MKIARNYLYLKSIFNLFKVSVLNNKSSKDKIKVGFFVQMLDVLNKTKILISRLENDDRFEVYVFCIPVNVDCQKKDLDNGNEAYEYCKGMFNNVINFILVITMNKVVKKLSGSGLW